MSAHGRRAVAFGSMVSARNVGDPTFTGIVGLRLGDLTGDEDIGPGGNGRFEITLSASCAERDVTHRPIGFSHQGDRPAELV